MLANSYRPVYFLKCVEVLHRARSWGLYAAHTRGCIGGSMGQSGAEDRNPGHDPSGELEEVLTVGETAANPTNDLAAGDAGVATAPTYGDADRFPTRVLSVKEPEVGYGQRPQGAPGSLGETVQVGGRSAVGKCGKWPKAGEPSAELLALCDGSVMLARLLMARGLGEAKDADAFLNTQNLHTDQPERIA